MTPTPGAIDLEGAWTALSQCRGAVTRAEAAEARVVELTGALINIEGQLQAVFMQDDWEADCLSIFEKIRAALSATPAEAMERAKALNSLERAVRIAWQSNWTDRSAMTEALAKLDTP